MALIVQDNTGEVAGANGYITTAFFTSYHTDRGVQDVIDGNFEDTEIQAAIVRATTYADSRFKKQFKGCKWKEPSLQTTEFPRLNICDAGNFDISETIPVPLQQAIAEYALAALNGELTVEPTVDDTGQQVKRKREKVDVLEEETEYHDTAVVKTTKKFPKADFLIRELLKPTGRVIRA